MSSSGAGRTIRGRLAPEAMFPADDPTIRVRRVALRDGLVIRVAESGAADAPPVLLLHGWGASMYMWRGWFAPLAAAGFRPVAIDLPGHGLSDKPETAGAYALSRQVEILRELFDLEGLAGATVVAQSMGGTIALEFALEHSTLVGPLVLVNAACFGRVRLQPLVRLISPSIVDHLLGRVVPRWVVARAHQLAYAHPARITSRDVDEYWAPSQFPAYARAMRRLLHEFHWARPSADRMAERLGMLTHRALVVIGGRDHLVHGAQHYLAALTSAGAPLEVHEMPASGHAVNEEEPAAVLELVMRFLRAPAHV